MLTCGCAASEHEHFDHTSRHVRSKLLDAISRFSWQHSTFPFWDNSIYCIYADHALYTLRSAYVQLINSRTWVLSFHSLPDSALVDTRHRGTSTRNISMFVYIYSTVYMWVYAITYHRHDDSCARAFVISSVLRKRSHDGRE